MIYLDENWTLKFKMGEIDTTRGLDYHVFYSEVFTCQQRDEKIGRAITQADSFEVTSGTSATTATDEVSMLIGPQARTSTEFNTNTSTSRRYKCRVVICNKDTITRTLFLFLENGSTERYLTYGLSMPAGSTFTWDENGQIISGTPITSVVAGNGLTGGGSSGVVTLDVQVDGSTLEINADTVRVKDVGITNAKIANATIDLTTKVTGVLPNANGGTNQSTYAKGDTLYASAANALSKLAIGTGRKRATIATDIPAWEYDWVYSTTNGTVGIADNLKFFNLDATGNITLNLTAAATLGSSHVFGVRKSDSTSGTLTIDANSTETIDGATTLVLYKQYDYAIIMCTGSAFVVLSKVLTPPKFSAYQSSAQTALARITDHKITFTTEEFDSHGWYDTSTSRFTPLLAGKYWVMVSIGSTAGGTDGQYWLARIYKNGALAKAGNAFPAGAASNQRGMACALIDFNGSSDYVEGHLYHVYSGNGDVEATADSTFFQAFYMGA